MPSASPVAYPLHCAPAIDAEGERLLQAAREVLDRSGWWGFKVASVLKQAGLSTRSFYRHFERKNDLLVAMLEHELGGAAVALHRVTAAAATPTDGVRDYINAILDKAYRTELIKTSSLFATHWRELLADYPEVFSRCLARLVAPLEQVIVEGVRRGELVSTAPASDARAILLFVAGVTGDEAVLGGVTPREELERIVFPLICRGLGMRVVSEEGQ